MITVAYSGVHEAFQIALAAHEAGKLEQFYTSLFDGPGKWGRRLAFILGEAVLINRRMPGLPPERVIELPIPFLRHRLGSGSSLTKNYYPWYQANFDFDRQVAQKLRGNKSRIFIGTETCAYNCFQMATKLGMGKILDCPQVHPAFLTEVFHRAANDLKIPLPPPFDPPELARRKQEEFAMADKLLIISDVQRRSFINAGFRPEKLTQIPLWVDLSLWQPGAVRKTPHAEPLKVLFVGNVELRKGIPYLIQAVEQCSKDTSLTLAGINTGETDSWIQKSKAEIKIVGRKNKAELKEIYQQHDVLVLPSLVDSFGFVALEAMACGLPVIVTENCGVPVPDPAWRVPIMDSNAIARRLEHYAMNRATLQHDGQVAQQFVQQFTPEVYRSRVKELLRELLKN